MIRVGECENAKGLVHALTGSLAFTMGIYNFLAFQERKKAHLAFNAGLYGSLWLYEMRQTWTHWQCRENQ